MEDKFSPEEMNLELLSKYLEGMSQAVAKIGERALENWPHERINAQAQDLSRSLLKVSELLSEMDDKLQAEEE